MTINTIGGEICQTIITSIALVNSI